MNIKLQKKLTKKYPKLFSSTKSLECGDGWYDLINTTCDFVQFHIDNNNHPQIHFTQIKEKFASIRLYYDGGDQFLDAIIQFAEELSKGICENCGTNLNVKTTIKGWMRTLCNDCEDKRS